MNIKIKQKIGKNPGNQTPCHSSFSAGIICGPHRGSFAVRDHLRPNLGIISGLGIICGAVQHLLLGKFPSKGANCHHRTASAYVGLCLCQSVNQRLLNIWKLICEKKNYECEFFSANIIPWDACGRPR